MITITQHDIDGLSAKEQMQLKAYINHDLGTKYARMQRKKISEARTKAELGIEGEPEC